MKHLKSVSKKTGPARAYVWDWFINLKGGIQPGLIMTGGKPWYVDALWQSPDSLDPTDATEDDLFLY